MMILKIMTMGLSMLCYSYVYAGIEVWTPNPFISKTTVLQNNPRAANLLYAATESDGLLQRDLNLDNSLWQQIDSASNYTVIPPFNQLLVNPFNPNQLIAAAVKQGIFTGTVTSQRWDVIFAKPNDVITDLLIDKEARFYAALQNFGLLMSENQGQTWQNIAAGLNDTRVNSLALGSKSIYAATHSGIFTTIDAGATWQTSSSLLQSIEIKALSNSPNFPDIIYATAPNIGIFKTINAGATWQTINNGLIDLSVQQIHVHPQNPNVVLVKADQVYLTTNGGKQWLPQNKGLKGLIINDFVFENHSQLRAHAATTVGIFEIDFNQNIDLLAFNQAPINQIPSQLPALVINQVFEFNSRANLIQVSDLEAGNQPILVQLNLNNGQININSSLNISNLEMSLNKNVLTMLGSQTMINTILSTISITPDRLGAGRLTITSNDLGSGTDFNAQQSNRIINFNVIRVDQFSYMSINNSFNLGIDSFFELFFDNIGIIAGTVTDNLRFSLENTTANIGIDKLTGHITGEFNQLGRQNIDLVITQNDQILRKNLTFNVTAQTDYDILQIVAKDIPNPFIIAIGQAFEFIVPISGGDGSPVTFSLDNRPKGLIFDQQKGLLSGIPANTGLFNLVININQNGTDSQYPLNIFVSDNHVPNLDFIANQILSPNLPFNFTATANDIDGNALVYYLEDAPLGAVIDANTGVFNWTPIEAGKFLITVIAEEQGLRDDPDTIYWDVKQQVLLEVVLDGNAPPVLEPVSTLHLQPNIPFSIPLKASDPNNDPFIYQLENPQLGMTINANTGVFSWDKPIVGRYLVTVEVEEEHIDAEARLEDEMQFLLRVDNDVEKVGESTWQPLGTGLADQSLQHLLISPVNNQEMYAGSAAGIYKSIDGGQSWNSSNKGLGTSRIQNLQIHPNNTQILYAQNSKGLFLTENAGLNWQLLDTGLENISCFTLDVENPDSLYLGTDNGLILHSENNSYQFEIINADSPLPSAINSLLVDRNEFEVLYAGTQSDSLFKSFDQGSTWQAYGSGLRLNQTILKLTGHPDNMDIIYAKTPEGLKATYNAGFVWQNLNASLEALTINVITLDPNHVDIIYLGTNKGVYRSIDAGQKWYHFGGILSDKNITDFTYNHSLPPTLYASSATTGIYSLPDNQIFPKEKNESADLGIEADDLLSLNAAALNRLPLSVFKLLDADDLQAFSLELMARLTALQLGNITENGVKGLTLLQFQKITDKALIGFNGNNIGGLSTDIIASLDSAKLSKLMASKIKLATTDDLAYFINALNPSLISPDNMLEFLPQGWLIDPINGDLKVPDDTLLRFNSINNSSIDIDLPDLPDLNQTLSLGGQGAAPTLLDEFNQILLNNPELSHLSFTQNDEGIIELSLLASLTSLFSFIPDLNNIRQVSANVEAGLIQHPDGSGRFILTTASGKQFIFNPAPKKVTAALDVLQVAFQQLNRDLNLQLKTNGELLIEGDLSVRRANNQASRIHRVVIFDPVIEPAPQGAVVGINTIDNTTRLMIYPDGTAQKAYAAILFPDEFKRTGLKITGVQNILNHVDGSSTVTYDNINYKILPTFETTSRTLGQGETFNTKIEPWVINGALNLRYSVISADQIITTRLLIQ